MRSKKDSCSHPYRRRKKRSSFSKQGNADIMISFGEPHHCVCAFLHNPSTAMPQTLHMCKSGCGYRQTHVLFKMVTHLDGVWWGGCGAPVFFFFFLPLLSVSKTAEIADQITFRWLVHNIKLYLNYHYSLCIQGVFFFGKTILSIAQAIYHMCRRKETGCKGLYMQAREWI